MAYFLSHVFSRLIWQLSPPSHYLFCLLRSDNHSHPLLTHIHSCFPLFLLSSLTLLLALMYPRILSLSSATILLHLNEFYIYFSLPINKCNIRTRGWQDREDNFRNRVIRCCEHPWLNKLCIAEKSGGENEGRWKKSDERNVKEEQENSPEHVWRWRKRMIW